MRTQIQFLVFCLGWALTAPLYAHSTSELPLSRLRPQVPPTFDLFRRANPRQRCQLQVLRQLGWEFRPSDRARHETGDQACTVDNAEAAHAKGWLAAEYNREDIGGFLESLPKLLESDASMCGYKFRVAEAALTATRKLKANHRFQFGDNDDAPDEYWSKEPFRLTPKKGTPSEVIGCFYDRSCTLECAGGRVAAQFAMLRELFGPEDMDKAFSIKEVAITRGYPTCKATAAPSPFFGETASDKMIIDRKGVALVKKGRGALVGFTGYLVAEDKGKLDSRPDVGENYLITQVSQAAAEELARNGGMEYYTKMNKRLWELKGEKRQMSAAEEEEVNKILARPMYRGVTVYVHPMGQRTMGDLVDGLLRINPRTPYRHDDIFADDLNTGLFQRYTSFYIDKCLGKK